MQVNYHVDNDDMVSHLGNRTLLGIHFHKDGYTLFLEYPDGNFLAISGTPDDGAIIEILALTDEPDDLS